MIPTAIKRLIPQRLARTTPLLRTLCLMVATSLLFNSCATIATYDDQSYVKTAELKARTMVLISHSNEEYSNYTGKIDDIMIMAETIYAIQKSRPKNFVTVKQWDVMMKAAGASNKGLLPDFFDFWKKKGKLNDFYIDEKKALLGAAFDEILKLEAAKLKL